MRPFFLALLSIGCDSGGATGVSDVADAPGEGDEEVGEFEPFTAHSWSYTDDDGPIDLSITDTSDLTACGLASDFDASPGGAARQIAARFDNPNYQSCPDGIHTIGDCEGSSPDELGRDCARFRQWNDDGDVVVDVLATAGALRLTDQGDRCRFELELTFPGGERYEDAFVIEPSGSPPWCVQD